MNRNAELALDIEHHGGVSIVSISGNLTIAGGDVALRDRVGALLRQGRLSLLLDLAGVAYMDSCGLAELVECQRHARNMNAEIKLLCPSAKVRGLLAITMLDQVFEIFVDLEPALASFYLRGLECGGGR